MPGQARSRAQALAATRHAFEIHGHGARTGLNLRGNLAPAVGVWLPLRYIKTNGLRYFFRLCVLFKPDYLYQKFPTSGRMLYADGGQEVLGFLSGSHTFHVFSIADDCKHVT